LYIPKITLATLREPNRDCVMSLGVLANIQPGPILGNILVDTVARTREK